jgi:CheY-like chemotaxis protein
MARRILLLDDHDGSRAIMVSVLTLHGHSCRVVDTPAQLVDAVSTFQPDLIIYDWNPRSKDRAGLASRLKHAASALERHPQIVVVSVIDEPDRFCEREGVDAYFTKPMRVTDVLLASRC